MGREFLQEVDYLGTALTWAAGRPTQLLMRTLQGFSGKNLLAVGSGGSYTAAAFCANMHERTGGQLGRAVTPLELLSMPVHMSGCATVLLSAEGKNKDILSAARRSLEFDLPSLVLTLTQNNPLKTLCDETGAATVVAHDMPWTKDGYLAVNSLVATLVILLRGYEPGSRCADELMSLPKWLEDFRTELALNKSATQLATLRNFLLLYDGTGKIGAIDLESKLSESALGFGQLADYRQFAHGRHLQLGMDDCGCCVIAFRPPNGKLADATIALVPEGVPVQVVQLPECSEGVQEIAGVLAAIAIVEMIAKYRQIDPGQPTVPQFGRDLHALDVAELAQIQHHVCPPLIRKFGAEPSSEVRRKLSYDGIDFIKALSAAEFKALVCDFDGTFCETAKRFDGLDVVLVPEIVRLLKAGLSIAFATGRGDSLIPDLRQKIPNEFWPQIYLGCYSGSLIFKLCEDPVFPAPDIRFADLEGWISAQGIFGQLGAKPKADCSQFGMRITSGNSLAKTRVIESVNRWIRLRGYKDWRIFCSAHSIDVLTENAGKCKVVDYISKTLGVDSETEILRIGDAGDFQGNDYELLSSGLGLSVNAVSPESQSCWNLLPINRRGVQGTLHYLQSLETGGGSAQMSSNFLLQSKSLLNVSQGKPV